MLGALPPVTYGISGANRHAERQVASPWHAFRSSAQRGGARGRRSPGAPYQPRPPGSPGAAALAVGRWLPPSALAPRTGSPPRCPPRSGPCATTRPVAGRAPSLPLLSVALAGSEDRRLGNA